MQNADIWGVVSSFCTLEDLVEIFCLSKSIYKIANSNHSWKERTHREFCKSQINEWLEEVESTYKNRKEDYKTIYRIFRTSIIGQYDICGHHDASNTFYRYNCEVDFRKSLDCDKRVTQLLFRQHEDQANISPVVKYASGYCYDNQGSVTIRFNDTYIIRLGRFQSFFQIWTGDHSTVSVSEHIVTEKGVHISHSLDQNGTFIMVKVDEQLHGYDGEFPKKLSNEYLQELVVTHLLSQPGLRKANDSFFPFSPEKEKKKSVDQNYLLTFTPYELSRAMKDEEKEELIGIRTPVKKKAMFTCTEFDESGLGKGEGYFFVTTEEDKEKNKLVIGKQKGFKVLFIHFRNYYAFAFFDPVVVGKIELCSFCRTEEGEEVTRLQGFTYFEKDEGIIDILTIEKKV